MFSLSQTYWSLDGFLHFAYHSLFEAAFVISVLRNMMQDLNALKDDGCRAIEEMILAFVKTPETTSFSHRVLYKALHSHRALKIAL